MNLFLSHPLDPKDLAWPGEPTLKVEQSTNIEEGAGFNSCISYLPNHFGTHFDAPKHFNKDGLSINELDIEYFVYKNVLLIDLPKGNKSYIVEEDLKPYEEEIQKADLLLIRTGFESKRSESSLEYQNEGPCIHPDCCNYMINTFKNLRSVGFDFLAIGAPWNDLAGIAHQNLLGLYSDKFITAIEDMKLAEIGNRRVCSVYLGPLRIVGADSGQVSVIAEVE